MDQSAFRAMLNAATVTRPVANTGGSSSSSTSSSSTIGTNQSSSRSSTTQPSKDTTTSSSSKNKGYTKHDHKQQHWKDKDSYGSDDKYKDSRYGSGSSRNPKDTELTNTTRTDNEKSIDTTTASSSSHTYRDRAYERRQNKGPTDELEKISESLNYEQSKYLGGDINRTHLVKGLDFTLLDKIRQQQQQEQQQSKNTVNTSDSRNTNTGTSSGSAVTKAPVPLSISTSSASSSSSSKNSSLLQLIHTVGGTLSSNTTSSVQTSSSLSTVPQPEQIQKLVAVLKNDSSVLSSALFLRDNYNRFAPGRVLFEYDINLHNYDRIVRTKEDDNTIPTIILHSALEVPKIPYTYTDDVPEDLLSKMDRRYLPHGSNGPKKKNSTNGSGSNTTQIEKLVSSSYDSLMDTDTINLPVQPKDKIHNSTNLVTARLSASPMDTNGSVTKTVPSMMMEEEEEEDIFAGLDRYVPPTEREPSKKDIAHTANDLVQNIFPPEDTKMDDVAHSSFSPSIRTNDAVSFAANERIIEPTSRIRRSRWDDRTELSSSNDMTTELLSTNDTGTGNLTHDPTAPVSQPHPLPHSSSSSATNTVTAEPTTNVMTTVPVFSSSKPLISSYLQLDNDDILEMGSEGIDEWERMENTETMAEKKRRLNEQKDYEYLHGKNVATNPTNVLSSASTVSKVNLAALLPSGSNIMELLSDKGNYASHNAGSTNTDRTNHTRASSSSLLAFGGDRRNEEGISSTMHKYSTGVTSSRLRPLGRWTNGGYGEEEDDDEEEEGDAGKSRQKRKKYK